MIDPAIRAMRAYADTHGMAALAREVIGTAMVLTALAGVILATAAMVEG